MNQLSIFFLLSFFFLHCRTNGQLTELFVVNFRRSIGHNVTSTLRLREGDYVTDGSALSHDHNQTVKTESQAAMRRRAVLEGIHHEAELGMCFFLREAQGFEYLFLQVCVVDTQGAAADFR